MQPRRTTLPRRSLALGPGASDHVHAVRQHVSCDIQPHTRVPSRSPCWTMLALHAYSGPCRSVSTRTLLTRLLVCPGVDARLRMKQTSTCVDGEKFEKRARRAYPPAARAAAPAKATRGEMIITITIIKIRRRRRTIMAIIRRIMAIML